MLFFVRWMIAVDSNAHNILFRVRKSKCENDFTRTYRMKKNLMSNNRHRETGKKYVNYNDITGRRRMIDDYMKGYFIYLTFIGEVFKYMHECYQGRRKIKILRILFVKLVWIRI